MDVCAHNYVNDLRHYDGCLVIIFPWTCGAVLACVFPRESLRDVCDFFRERPMDVCRHVNAARYYDGGHAFLSSRMSQTPGMTFT